MKLTPVVFLLFIFSHCTAQSVAQSKAALIASVKAEFRKINADTAYQTKVLNNQEYMPVQSDGGSRLTGYFKKGKIRKIISWIGLSYGAQITEYSFKDEKLIFIYDTFNSFVFDNEAQSLRLDSLTKTFEGRYYFYKNEKISSFEKGSNPLAYEFDMGDPTLPQVHAERLKRILARQ